MKVAHIFFLIACLLTLGCDKSDDETRAEKSARDQAVKNLEKHKNY